MLSLAAFCSLVKSRPSRPLSISISCAQEEKKGGEAALRVSQTHVSRCCEGCESAVSYAGQKLRLAGEPECWSINSFACEAWETTFNERITYGVLQNVLSSGYPFVHDIRSSNAHTHTPDQMTRTKRAKQMHRLQYTSI